VKHKLLIAIILLFSSLSLPAQFKDFVCGLKLGANMQWVDSDEPTLANKGLKMGYNWGFAAEYYFVENYAIASGFTVDFLRNRYSFSDRRSKDGTNFFDVNVNRLLRGTYFEIPLKIKMKTDRFGKCCFFAEVGYGFGVKLNAMAKDSYNINGVVVMDDDFIDVDEQYKWYRSALILNAGTEYTLNGSTKLFANLVYNRGFSNLYVDVHQKGVDLKTNFVGLELGLIF
jgi:hypothetical protein